MRSLSRIIRFFPEFLPAVPKARSTSRRGSPIGLDLLETRQLLSIPGVTLQFGNISITGTKTSGNVAEVSVDPSNHNVKVSLNGQSEEFSSTLVFNVTYIGGKGGGDTFSDNTGLVSLEYGYGGNDNFTGGTSFNYVFFFGNSNTYTGPAGSISDVFEDGGIDNTIGGAGIIYVYPRA